MDELYRQAELAGLTLIPTEHSPSSLFHIARIGSDEIMAVNLGLYETAFWIRGYVAHVYVMSAEAVRETAGSRT